jgi:PAP2 superfamily
MSAHRDAVADEARVSREAHTAGRLMTAAIFAWLIFIVLLMVLLGGDFGPDFLLVLSGLLAMAMLADRPFFREVLPFPIVALAWEAMRGLASDVADRANVADVVAWEHALFGGTTPSVTLQRAFHTPGTVSLLDILMTTVYLGHFVVPVAVGYLMWRHSRTVFYRYSAAIVLVALAGYATQLIFPAAPPRLSGLYGTPLAVTDIARQTLEAFRAMPIAAWGYGNLSGNEVAAMPSLHAAFPLMAALFLFQVRRWHGWAMLAYTGVVWFAIVYLGQHFLVDAIAGSLYTVLVYIFVTSPAYERVASWLTAPWRPIPSPEG